MKKSGMIFAAMLGLLCLTAPKQVTANKVLKADTQTTHTHEGWTSIKGLNAIDSFLTKENDKYYLNAGSYYLDSNLILSKDIYIKGNTEVNLCLNDKMVTSYVKDTTSSYQFHIENQGTFNVFDETEHTSIWYLYDEVDSDGNSNEDGIFETHSYDFNTSKGYLYGKDYLKVEGGLFTGFLTEPIFVDEFATFNMNGGSFGGNYSANDSSCIFVRINSSINLSNVTFTGNYSRHGGAIYASNTTDITLNDINASYNKGINGGFLHSSGTVNINGGTYQHNQAQNGSVFYLGAASTLNLAGALFEYNLAGTPTSPSSNGLLYCDSSVNLRQSYSFDSCIFRNNITYTDDLYNQNEGGAYGVLSDYYSSTSNKICFGGSTIMEDNYVVNLNEYSKGSYRATECNFRLLDSYGVTLNMLNGDSAPKEGMSIGLTCVDADESGMTIATGLDKDYSSYFTSDAEDMYISSLESNGTYSLQCLKAASPVPSDSEYVYPDDPDNEQKTESNTNSNALPIIAIVLSSLSLVGVGLSFFFQFRKKQ